MTSVRICSSSSSSASSCTMVIIIIEPRVSLTAISLQLSFRVKGDAIVAMAILTSTEQDPSAPHSPSDEPLSALIDRRNDKTSASRQSLDGIFNPRDAENNRRSFKVARSSSSLEVGAKELASRVLAAKKWNGDTVLCKNKRLAWAKSRKKQQSGTECSHPPVGEGSIREK